MGGQCADAVTRGMRCSSQCLEAAHTLAAPPAPRWRRAWARRATPRPSPRSQWTTFRRRCTGRGGIGIVACRGGGGGGFGSLALARARPSPAALPYALRGCPWPGAPPVRAPPLPPLSRRCGYQSRGWEVMYSGHTGRALQAQIFLNPTYYQRLKHMVDDKIHSRWVGLGCGGVVAGGGAERRGGMRGGGRTRGTQCHRAARRHRRLTPPPPRPAAPAAPAAAAALSRS